MVSFVKQSSIEHPPSIDELARFLQRPEEDVAQLLADGRLGGAILHALRTRGAAVTPAVKDSVQALVRAMEAVREGASAVPSGTAQATATATIMFTDVVGSSTLMARLGDREGRRALTRHDQIIRRETAAHNGTEVKSLGDGFMLTFASARNGVACASAVQRMMAEHNSRRSATTIPVRIGISVGEPVSDSDDLYGISVIMAARITAKAKGGQVLVSEVVHTLASSSREFEFRPLGTTKLKGVEGKHRIYEVLWPQRSPASG